MGKPPHHNFLLDIIGVCSIWPELSHLQLHISDYMQFGLRDGGQLSLAHIRSSNLGELSQWFCHRW